MPAARPLLDTIPQPHALLQVIGDDFALLALALAVRLALFDFLTGDAEFWVIPWYDYLNSHGLAAFATQFPNAEGWADTRASYSPPYHYLLYVATLFDGLAPKLYLIKMVSVTFDLVAAGMVFGIVRLWSPLQASRAFFAVLFLSLIHI